MKKEQLKVPKPLTKKFIKWFEQEQKEYGTEVALGNVIWNIGADIMHIAGVKTIKTTYYK